MTTTTRSDFIHIGCDNDVPLEGALNVDTDNYINDATVSFTLYAACGEENGEAVAGATSISMPYVAASNGNYVGVLQSTVALTENAYYFMVIDLVQGDIVLKKRWKVQAVYEGHDDSDAAHEPPESVLLPALTGDMLVDTLNSLLAQRLQVILKGPKPSYNLHGHSVSWNQYLVDLDRRILAVRREMAQASPWEEVGVGV